MIDKKLGFSLKTQKLIERQCACVERKNFVVNKSVAVEAIMKTYDIFNLPRPKNVVWLKDLSSKEWNDAASSALSAALSASSASSAWSARSASFASFARSALDLEV